MKATITHAEWQYVAELLLDGQQLLAGVEDIEKRIAAVLGLDPGAATAGIDRDIITDAVSGTLNLDALLLTFNIGVEGQSA